MIRDSGNSPRIAIIASSPFISGICKSIRSEEHTSELQSRLHLVCRLLLEKKKTHDEHSLTLGLLADLYLESLAHLSKKPRMQRAESQILRRVVEVFGRT